MKFETEKEKLWKRGKKKVMVIMRFESQVKTNHVYRQWLMHEQSIKTSGGVMGDKMWHLWVNADWFLLCVCVCVCVCVSYVPMSCADPQMNGRNWKSSSPHTPWLPAGSIRYTVWSLRIKSIYLCVYVCVCVCVCEGTEREHIYMYIIHVHVHAYVCAC